MASDLDNFFKDKFRLKEKIKEAEKQLQLLYDNLADVNKQIDIQQEIDNEEFTKQPHHVKQ